jgi:hypothetical protein
MGNDFQDGLAYIVHASQCGRRRLTHHDDDVDTIDDVIQYLNLVRRRRRQDRVQNSNTRYSKPVNYPNDVRAVDPAVEAVLVLHDRDVTTIQSINGPANGERVRLN